MLPAERQSSYFSLLSPLLGPILLFVVIAYGPRLVALVPAEGVALPEFSPQFRVGLHAALEAVGLGHPDAELLAKQRATSSAVPSDSKPFARSSNRPPSNVAGKPVGLTKEELLASKPPPPPQAGKPGATASGGSGKKRQKLMPLETKEDLDKMDFDELNARRVADGMPPLKKESKPKEGPNGLADYPPMNKDIPYIKCQVCRRMASEAYASVQRILENHTGRELKKVRQHSRFEHVTGTGEVHEHVDAVVDRVCDFESDEGAWMAQTDIVKEGEALHLIDYKKQGTCRRECRTMQKTCEALVESMDFELASYMHKLAEQGVSSGVAQQRVCNQLSKVCKKGNTPPYLGKRKNEDFWPFTDAEVRMQMAKKMMGGKFEQINEPVRQKPRDDIDDLHDEA